MHGTMVGNIRLTDDEQDIECNGEKVKGLVLKTVTLKRPDQLPVAGLMFWSAPRSAMLLLRRQSMNGERVSQLLSG